MASCASDGLVKIWNVKDENCATTLDNHEEKVREIAKFQSESSLMLSPYRFGLWPSAAMRNTSSRVARTRSSTSGRTLPNRRSSSG